MTGRLSLVAALLFTAPALLGQTAPTAPAGDEGESASPADIEAMNKARATFEYGKYAAASKMLEGLIAHGHFESAALRAEAYKLFGLALLNQGRKSEAYPPFLELLLLDPDAEFDPFYVSPDAIELLSRVKKDAEAQLAPIRAQRRAEAEARKKAADDERHKRDQDDETRRLAALQPNVERRVVQREFWVSVLPFGVGQLQNGDRSLGIALATSEVIAGAASAGSALLIEELRDTSSGKFGPGVYPLANRLSVVKWIGAGIFYGLWAAGAIHAAIRYQPEERIEDRLLMPPAIGATSAPVLPPQPLPLPQPQAAPPSPH